MTPPRTLRWEDILFDRIDDVTPEEERLAEQRYVQESFPGERLCWYCFDIKPATDGESIPCDDPDCDGDCDWICAACLDKGSKPVKP